jgi:hypothetical protein
MLYLKRHFFLLEREMLLKEGQQHLMQTSFKATATSDEGRYCQLLMQQNDFELSFCAACV